MIFNKTYIFFIFLIFTLYCFSKTFTNCKRLQTAPNQLTTHAPTQLTTLGRYLFFDRRLSVNNTRACGTCHNPQFAFTDGYKRSLGAFADLHQRNTQPLFNLASLKYFTSADSTLHTALQQMENPLYNTHPIEMGVQDNEEFILKRISTDTFYKKIFSEANVPIQWQPIKLALAQFVNSISSTNTAYDKFLKGNVAALSQNEKAGMNLFFSANLNCNSCHGGKNFNTPSHLNVKGDTIFYYNTGLYNIDGSGAYPTYDIGLAAHTKNKKDEGAYRVPTLRNLAYTAPYLHDGSAATLLEIIDNYSKAGRVIANGIHKGDGRKNIYKHSAIKGFAISDKEKHQLLSFLLALGDSNFVNNPEYKNPFLEDETKR